MPDPSTCFCTVVNWVWFSYFLMVEKKLNEEYNFVTHENYKNYEIQIVVFINIYWNKACP
jgi:hypothetical protein